MLFIQLQWLHHSCEVVSMEVEFGRQTIKQCAYSSSTSHLKRGNYHHRFKIHMFLKKGERARKTDTNEQRSARQTNLFNNLNLNSFP